MNVEQISKCAEEIYAEFHDRAEIEEIIARYAAEQGRESEDERVARIVHRVVTDRNVVVRTNGVVEDVEALARGETIDWPGFEEWCRMHEKRGYR